METVSVALLKTHFSYSRRTGQFTRKLRAAGSLAGSKNHASGYVHIKFRGRIYKAHRMAWAFVTGRWPRRDVEHKNRIKNNNQWRNLRLANDSQNQANVGRRKDNTSGCKSVHLRKDNGNWRARIQVKHKRISLGSFSTPELAHAAYCKAAKKHFGEFARAR